MPLIETADRHQEAVLWPRVGSDKHGQPTLGPPVPLLVRWVEKQHEMLDPKGNTIAVDATAVVDRKVPVDSIMWLGCIDDLEDVGASGPSPLGLMSVKAANETPDIKGRNFRRTVGMMRFRNKLPTIVPAAVTLAIATSGTPSTFGNSVTFTATVSVSLARGFVRFYDGTSLLGDTLAINGVGIFATSELGRGTHSITAVYEGDQHYQPATSPILVQSVT